MDQDEFKQAMARFPAGVTIVTTRDAEGTAWGFTASSFSSLSLEPPLVLVCLADGADSAPAFADCERMAISILAGEQEALALRFARKDVDKFVDGGWHDGPDGVPVIDGARAVLSGPVAARHPGGDHTILVLRVDAVELGDAPTTLTYAARAFHALP
jgi:flavin reductase ActVB